MPINPQDLPLNEHYELRKLAKNLKLTDKYELAKAIKSLNFPILLRVNEYLYLKLNKEQYKTIVSQKRKFRISKQLYLKFEGIDLGSPVFMDKILNKSIDDLYVFSNQFDELKEKLEKKILKSEEDKQIKKDRRGLHHIPTHEEIHLAAKQVLLEFKKYPEVRPNRISGSSVARYIDDNRHRWKILKTNKYGTDFENIRKIVREHKKQGHINYKD